ncbi:unnamed protein product [Schistosoma margrebowiei]|uniref:Uncharacterized protein n=1 Tax=Schistosoma margrebowiei TaxID=48269 RepID=A0A183LTC0_9TREM|nr:unnamed protein product [Schistosoma margrebowiei]
MVVGGSRQETLDPGFVLLGTRQQGVPVISSFMKQYSMEDKQNLLNDSFLSAFISCFLLENLTVSIMNNNKICQTCLT